MHVGRNRTEAEPKAPLHNIRPRNASSDNQQSRIFIVSPTGGVTESTAEQLPRAASPNRKTSARTVNRGKASAAKNHHLQTGT
jgi:phage replication-related protein YjqB (UPF0714/DUF867 family)